MTLPDQLRQKMEAELKRGERVLWADTPIPRFFTPGSVALFAFGFVWTGFTVGVAVVLMCLAVPFLREVLPGAGFIPLLLVPFILVGLGLLLSPIWLYRRALKTVYAVTDRRAISIAGGWSTTVRSFGPEDLQNVFRRERGDGTGDVVIAERSWRDSDGDRRREELGFFGIRDPRLVERMLRELAERDSSATG